MDFPVIEPSILLKGKLMCAYKHLKQQTKPGGQKMLPSVPKKIPKILISVLKKASNT